jgi:predicted DCC family thiol-disulfide oxidoreductase YuxK
VTAGATPTIERSTRHTVARSARWTMPFAGNRPVALFDGHCRFCSRSARRLQRMVGSSRLQIRSFQDEGVLEAFPGVSYEACMKRLHLVQPNGRVTAGAEAIARAMTLRPTLGVLAFLYYVPVLRFFLDVGYAVVARYRYRLFGRAGSCDPNGTCHLHGAG